MAKVAVVTACDYRHFELGRELIASLRAIKQRDFAIGFIRMGSHELPADISTSVDHTAQVAKDRDHMAAIDGFDVAYLGVKTRLPELMPGFDTYVWMDGDTWLQNIDGIHQAVEGAQHASVAAACQADANYWARRTVTNHTIRAYMSIYGEEETRKWAVFPMINRRVLHFGHSGLMNSRCHVATRMDGTISTIPIRYRFTALSVRAEFHFTQCEQ